MFLFPRPCPVSTSEVPLVSASGPVTVPIPALGDASILPSHLDPAHDTAPAPVHVSSVCSLDPVPAIVHAPAPVPSPPPGPVPTLSLPQTLPMVTQCCAPDVALLPPFFVAPRDLNSGAAKLHLMAHLGVVLLTVNSP